MLHFNAKEASPIFAVHMHTAPISLSRHVVHVHVWLTSCTFPCTLCWKLVNGNYPTVETLHNTPYCNIKKKTIIVTCYHGKINRALAEPQGCHYLSRWRCCIFWKRWGIVSVEDKPSWWPRRQPIHVLEMVSVAPLLHPPRDSASRETKETPTAQQDVACVPFSSLHQLSKHNPKNQQPPRNVRCWNDSQI